MGLKKWEYKPLPNVVEILDKNRQPINRKERLLRKQGKKQDELYPYYGATGLVDYIDSYLIDGEFVLLGEDGAPFLDAFSPKAYIINGKSWVNNHAHVLKSRYNNKFLCYYLNCFNYKGYVSGTTRLKLTQSDMKRILVPVPPIKEQEKIVKQIEESLSQLDSAVATLNKTKQQLEIYRQAVIKEAFDRVSLDDYNSLKTVIVGTPQNGLYKPKSDYGTGTCILRIDGFYDGRILDDYDYKRVRLDDNELEKYSLQVNDLVINRVNSMQYLGKCALVRTLAENTIFESNMMRIKLNPSLVDYEYIIYYLSSVQGKKELTKNAKQAVNQASINQTDVCNTIVPLPDVSVQRELRNSIDIALSIYKDIGSAIHQSLQQAEALRQSILKQAFEVEY